MGTLLAHCRLQHLIKKPITEKLEKQTLASGRGCDLLCEGLMIKFASHRQQDKPRPFVNQAFGEMAAMLGMSPKLQWRALHIGSDKHRSAKFHRTSVRVHSLGPPSLCESPSEFWDSTGFMMIVMMIVTDGRGIVLFTLDFVGIKAPAIKMYPSVTASA
jgi:hypothetical protein